MKKLRILILLLSITSLLGWVIIVWNCGILEPSLYGAQNVPVAFPKIDGIGLVLSNSANCLAIASSSRVSADFCHRQLVDAAGNIVADWSNPNAFVALADLATAGNQSCNGFSLLGDSSTQDTYAMGTVYRTNGSPNFDANQPGTGPGGGGWTKIDSHGNITGSNDVSATAYRLTTDFTSQAADYNAATTDGYILLAGNHKVTLPTSVGMKGRIYWIMCNSAGTNSIQTTSAQTFLGYGQTAAASWTNSQVGRSTMVMSDGANWIVWKSDN